MIKRMSMLGRKDDMAFDVFSDYWFAQHSQIVKRLPHIRAYVQNHIIRFLPDLSDIPYKLDGLAELWFSDENKMRESFSSTTARMMVEDEKKFISAFTGYAVDNSSFLDDASLPKVMVVASSKQDRYEFNEFCSEWCGIAAHSLVGLHRLDTNFVSRIYHKGDYYFEPVPADVFITLRFVAEDDIRRALLSNIFKDVKNHFSKVGVYVVKERRVV